MNTVVIYQSSTGFTKQYALWLAETVACRAISLKEVSEKDMEGIACVIFGGWVMGGMISGLDEMRKMKPQKLIVFAVGSTPETIVDASSIKVQNHLETTPFFYLAGGFRFEKLNFAVRGILKALKKSVAKKENKTAQEQFMAATLGTSVDYSNRKQLDPLVNYLKENLRETSTHAANLTQSKTYS